MSYKCLSCGREFETPKVVRDTIPYGSQYVQGPEYDCCPYCSGDFKEAKVCEFCGDSYIGSIYEGVCNNCINIVAKRHSDLLKEKFTLKEIEILNAFYDGRRIE